MRIVLTLATLLACSVVPASAQPHEQPTEAATLLAETEAFGAWLMRFNAIEAPLLAEFQRLGPEWTAATSGWTEQHRAGLRAYAARVAAIVSETNARLAALDRPDFPNLEAGAELSTSALIETMIRNNRELQAVVEGMIPLHIAAGRNDRQAALRAAEQLVSGIRGVIRSQILLARASQATTPVEHPYWHSIQFHLVFLRVGDRLMSAAPNAITGTRDMALSANLAAMATELESNARAGNEKADTMLASLTELLSGAQGVEAQGLRRQIDLIRTTRANFPLSLEFAELLRRTAASLRDGRVENARTTSEQYPAFRQRMDAITNAENAVLAGVN